MFEDDTVADWAERPQTSAMNGYADRCGSFRLVVDGGNENRALVANGGRAVAEVGGQLGQCDAEKRKRLARSTGPAIKRHCYSLRCAMARHSTETSGWLTRTAGACEDAVGVGATRRDDFYVLGYHAYYEKGHRL